MHAEAERARARAGSTDGGTDGGTAADRGTSERAIPPHFLRRPIRAPAAAPAHLFSTLPSFFLPRPFPPFLQSFPKSIHYGGHNNSRWRQARRSHGRFPPLPCLHAPHGLHSNYRQKPSCCAKQGRHCPPGGALPRTLPTSQLQLLCLPSRHSKVGNSPAVGLICHM